MRGIRAVVKIIVIVPAIIVGVVALAYFTQEPPAPPELPLAHAVDPPAGASVLPDDVRAADVIRGVIAARNPEDADTAAAGWIDSWTPMRGWRGAVKRVEHRQTTTWFSVEMFDSTVIGNQFYLYCEVDGGVPQVKPGVEVIVRGRIERINGTRDAALMPGGIVLDDVTVVSPPPPGP